MLKKNVDKRYLKIIKHYGPKHQQKKLAEENYELQEAITTVELREQNHLREINWYEEEILIDEISDNLVLLMEYIQYYNLPIDKINKRIEYKLDRQDRRMKNGE